MMIQVPAHGVGILHGYADTRFLLPLFRDAVVIGPPPEPSVMKRVEEGAGHRHARLEGLILEELRALLRDDVSDPALGDVWVTAVVLSVDYRHARVHFTVTGPAEGPGEERDGSPAARAEKERALDRATPFLRAQLAIAIDLKRVPDLRFVFDGVAPREA